VDRRDCRQRVRGGHGKIVMQSFTGKITPKG
jgi:hypothetical protein